MTNSGLQQAGRPVVRGQAYSEHGRSGIRSGTPDSLSGFGGRLAANGGGESIGRALTT
jgi:hypothetical protein